jgi:hypothetical protein
MGVVQYDVRSFVRGIVETSTRFDSLAETSFASQLSQTADNSIMSHKHIIRSFAASKKVKHQWVTRISATLQRANSYFLYHGYRRLMITDSSSEFDIAQEAFENLEASG